MRKMKGGADTHTHMHKADHKSGAYSLSKSPLGKKKDDDGFG